jgi:LacI family transcriptional regulator
MKKKTTIYDIANKLNITAATVSRALNDNKLISAKTKELVLATAKELNYEKNASAFALKSGKTKLIGLVVPYINRHFFSNIIMGVEEELNPMGYHVMIFQSNESYKKEKDIIDRMLISQVDGIMISIAKSIPDSKHLEKIINQKIPLVFFDRKIQLKNTSSVVLDDVEGGRLATNHLIQQGCSKIACVISNPSLDIYRNRLNGFIKAHKENGMNHNRDLIFEADSSLESGHEVANKIIAVINEVDAVFCSSDYTALGISQRLQEEGINIPKKIKIVGFSNEPFTSLLELPLSTVEQSPYEMGKTSARILLDQLKNEVISIEHSVKLQPKLVERLSSKTT